MRILMVSQAVPFLPCHDGFRIIPAHLLRELSGRHEIHLLALADGSERPEQLAWPSQYSAGVKLAPGLPLLSETLRSRIASIRPDVLHLEGPNMAPLARHAPSSLPCILSAHDCLWLRYSQFVPFARSFREACSYRLRAWRGRRLEKRWYKGLHRIVVTSPSDREALAQWMPAKRIAVIPNGVDLDHWRYRPVPEPARIVFTGNMAWPPNEDAAEYFAKESFPRVRREFPGAEFWIAGASPSTRVRALADIAGVKVTGTVPDLREFVWSAAVYVSPLRFGAGVKNKILEAMALGAPIVATPASLTGTPLEHGRHVLVAESAPEIAAAVLRLLADRDLARSISGEARRHVEQNYSWESIAIQFERAWQTSEENGRV